MSTSMDIRYFAHSWVSDWNHGNAHFLRGLARELGRPVAKGVFGADMQVTLINDGPVTIWLDSRARE